MPDLNTLVQSYVEWLEIKAPDHRAMFLRRLKDDPEAAHAEAVTFRLLRTTGFSPSPGEIIGTGGVDFQCRPERRNPIAVEVTALRTSTVEKVSGLPHAPEDMRPRAFKQITTSLLREAINKAGQMADYPMPRLLVLATEHGSATLLMNAYSAEELLTGSTMISVPIWNAEGGNAEGDTEIVTQLKNSVFFRGAQDGSVESARRSISAILLMNIMRDSCSVIGLLHPDPVHPFDPDAMDQIHFARLRNWPVVRGDRLSIEWIGPKPEPSKHFHFPIKITDAELRRLD